MSYISRYRDGECESVWRELGALGDAVRSPAVLEDARAVAAETMDRVRRNLLVLEERLPSIGYQFNAPLLDPPRSVVRPATPKDLEQLVALERENGLLPLSLTAYYSVLAEVNLAQSFDQLVQWPDREAGAPYTELEILGEFGPIAISPLTFLMRYRHSKPGLVEAPLIPDEASNAYYSGDYYYTWLPNAHADASVGAWFPGNELFVAYLRQAFRHGGFHGMRTPDGEAAGGVLQFPSLASLVEIAGDLLSI